MTRIGIAVVGLGAHTQLRLLPALRRLEGAQLVGGVDPDPAIRRQVEADAPGLPTTSTLDELVARADIAAVVVAVPPAAAPTIAQDALARGWPVYLEKPGAVGRADLPTAGPGDPVLVPGLCYRHEPAVRAVADAVARGDVGRLVAARFVFASPDRPAGWRARPAEGGGVLRDLAIHDLDLARMLAGEPPETLAAQLTSRHTEQDTASIALTTDAGTVVQILAAQSAAETSTLEVLGEEGSLAVDRWSAPWVVRRGSQAIGPIRSTAETATRLMRPSAWRAAVAARRPGATQERALAAFVSRVRGEASDAPTFDELRAAFELVEACERAAASGGRVVIG